MKRQQEASIALIQPSENCPLPAATRSGFRERILSSPKPRLRRKRRRLLAVALLALSALVLPLHAQEDESHARNPIELGPRMPDVTVPTVFRYTRFNWHPEANAEAEAKRRRITFHAWLANPLKTPLENVTATLSTRQSAVRIVKGTLHFAYVRANSSAPADDTFTIENDSTAKLNLDDFVWTVGLPLGGRPDEPASKAIVDLPPVGVDSSQIQGSVILTRMDVRITPDATVQQVNAALAKVGGQIVSMRAGDLAVTIAVPKQASPDALRKLADTLQSQPGISLARPAFTPVPDTFKTNGGLTTKQADLVALRFLMPARFPAAINVGTSRGVGSSGAGQGPLLDENGLCKDTPIDIILPDDFGATIPADLSKFVPTGLLNSLPKTLSGSEDHGYVTGSTIGAANPYWACLKFFPILLSGKSWTQVVQAVADEMAHHSRFIVSQSLGYGTCGVNPLCVAPTGPVPSPADRANDALTWKIDTMSLWDDFLMVNSAGNSLGSTGAAIYPGAGQAAFNSPATIAESAAPLFTFTTDPSLWDPHVATDANGNPYLPLTADNNSYTSLKAAIELAGMDGNNTVENNVLTVGSSTNEPRTAVLTQYVPPQLLTVSSFSNSGADVEAVGEGIFDPGRTATAGDPDGEGFDGTSFSTPTVAGLVSYLWLLSPDLHKNQSMATTRQAILANTRGNSIDAYASVLSLDQSVEPTPTTAPIRMALLDVDGDSAFTDKDIAIFLRFLYFVDGAGNITHDPPTNTNADYSRYDLNGDGFTTSDSSHTERFDLDRVGSTQYGATSYSIVTQEIEDQTVSFVESALTDVEILCYYAYSPLYTGDNDARKSLLDGRCGISVSPKTATLSLGQKQQFTVSAPSDVTVTWSADCGTIDQNGLYTATVVGTCKVTATSDVDKNVSDSATVTITSPCSNFPHQDALSDVGLFFRNHGQTKEDDLSNQSGSLSESLPGPNGSASGSVGQGFYHFAAGDPDTAKDAGNSGVQVQGDFFDQVILNPADPSLIGENATATATVEVVANLQVGGANAAVDWSLNIAGNDMSGENSIVKGPQGDASGKTYTITIPVVLGQSFQISSGLTAVAGYGIVPPPDSPTGSASITVDVDWEGISNVVDQKGNPVSFTVCSYTGTNWAARQ